MSDKRWKKLSCSEQFMGEILRERKPGAWIQVYSGGLPEDAHVVRSWHDDERCCWWVVFESAEWPELPEGALIASLSELDPLIVEKVFPCAAAAASR